VRWARLIPPATARAGTSQRDVLLKRVAELEKQSGIKPEPGNKA
jgi:hypothetical protein